MSLPPREVQFWYDLIERYLKPLEKDKEKEKLVTLGLKELRNQMVFSFLMINSIWVIMIFLMQDNKDILGIRYVENVVSNAVGAMYISTYDVCTCL